MDTPDILVKVEGISKRYYPTHRALSFRETIENFFSKKSGSNNRSFLALEDVSFEVKKGEVLGIIGKNGAGKSTVLRILSGITQPTSGQIFFNGKVASILEIGTGFHPELSGRENIYLSGTLLGMTEPEVGAKETEIARFSGINDFLDVPVKHYSSGMFLRLAFSISTHMNADILLIDEVLAVGDAAFRIKGLEKIKSLLSTGKAVVLVSHDLSSISGLCDRVIVLEKGKIISEGKPSAIVSDYIEQTIENHRVEQEEVVETKKNTTETVFNLFKSWEEKNAPGNEWIKILSLKISAASPSLFGEILMTDSIRFEIGYRKLKSIQTNLSLFISWQLEQPVLSATPLRSVPELTDNDDQAGDYQVIAEFPPSWFNSGIFSAGLYFVTADEKEKINFPDLIHFKVNSGPAIPGAFQYDGNFPGPLFPSILWKRTNVSK